MRAPLVLIDGYNVIRRTPALANAERRSLEHGRAALITLLAARYRAQAARIVVVFDGAGQTETSEAQLGMRIIYSAAGCTADDCLVRLAREAEARGDAVTLATDDQGLRAALGGLAPATQTQGAADLGQRLLAPSRLLEKQYRHRAAVKRLLASEDDDDVTGGRGRPPKRRR